MQGYLRIFVLRELTRREMTGYELMKRFESFSGTKMPSPGTIYPLLNSLLKKGLVSVSVRQNKKIYRISEKGERVLGRLVVERKKALESLISMLGTIYGKREIRRMRLSLSIMSGGKPHLIKDFDVLNAMRETIFDFVTSRSYSKKRQEFRALIQQTSQKIIRLGK